MGLKRNSWMWISLLLCIFGFFREIRPSEPFSIEFFIHWRNLTNEDLTRYVYPVGTYSFLAQLVIMFLVTDMLRYLTKKIIILYKFCVKQKVALIGSIEFYDLLSLRMRAFADYNKKT